MPTRSNRRTHPLGPVAGIALTAACLLGCAAPAPDNPGLAGDTVELAFPADDYEHVYHAAANALEDLGFTLDRADYRFGVLTTQPLRVGTFAEPWLPTDNAVPRALAATGAQQQRVVRVRLIPNRTAATQPASLPAYPPPPARRPGASFDQPASLAAHPLPGTDYRLDITAAVEQLALPARRPARSTRATHKLDTLDAIPAEQQQNGITDSSYYHAVARDRDLEERLLEKIVERL